MIRRFKLYAKIILGRENYIPRQIKQRTALYGAPGYGQYYLSKETKEPLIVYSFGIGEEIYFCERLLEKYHDIEIFAFDPTPKAKAFYLSHQVAKDKRFHYFEYGLSDKNEMTTFYLPKNKDYVSGSEVKWDGVDTNDSIRVQMRSLDSLMWQLGHDHIDILKIDIEGSEFKVIPQIISTGCQFNQLCIEVHQRFFPNPKETLWNMINQLNVANYYIAKVSTSGQEILFVKKD